MPPPGVPWRTGLPRRLLLPRPAVLGGSLELGDSGLDAAGKNSDVRRRAVVAGQSEGDLAVVGEDRDADAQRRGDRNVGNDLDQLAAEGIERLLRARDVGGDRDDLPLRKAEGEPDEHRRQRERREPAQGYHGLAGRRLLALLELGQLAPDGGQPLERVGDVHRQVGHERRYLVVVTGLLALVPDRDGNERRNRVGRWLFAAGDQ